MYEDESDNDVSKNLYNVSKSFHLLIDPLYMSTH